MNKFITFRDKDDNGQLQYYILQRDFPHYVGRIETNPYGKALIKVPIPQYNMYVSLTGTLRGALIPSYRDVPREVEDVIFSMANWFKVNRIDVEPKKYQKFKIISNATSPND